MNKKVIWIGVIVSLFLLFVGKDIVAGIAVSGVVRAVTGLRLSMNLSVGIFKPVIRVRNMKLYNPAGFSQPVMMDMPELAVRYDLGAFLKGGVHLQEALVDLKEFTVERNAKGQLNLDALKFVQEKKARGKAPPPARQNFQVDRLRLKVGRVVFKDFSVSPPNTVEFPLNLDESYTGIRSPQVLGSLIVARALTKTAIARLTHFDIDSLVGDLSGTVRRATGLATDLAGGAVDTGFDAAKKTGDTLKNLLPFKRE